MHFFSMFNSCSRRGAEDNASGSAVSVELVPLIQNLSFSHRRAAADMDDVSFASDLTRLGRHRPQIIYLDFQRGVTRAVGSVEWTAQPIAESSNVAASPPCTTPIGL